MAITGRATFGQLCGDELMSVVDVAVLYGGGFCAGDLFPSLSFVDVVTGLTRRLWRARRHLDGIFDKIIAECEARRRQAKTTTGTTNGDGDGLLSVLLRIRDEGETGISMTSIKAILFVSAVKYIYIWCC
jgi:9beta-pimara-7,15-diene oxidase